MIFSIAISVQLEAILDPLHIHHAHYPWRIGAKFWVPREQIRLQSKLRKGRAAAFGFENTSFNRADIAAYVPPNPFDAIVGRLVLQFVADPIRGGHHAVRRLAAIGLGSEGWMVAHPSQVRAAKLPRPSASIPKLLGYTYGSR
jgi:hypothetical protein